MNTEEIASYRNAIEKSQSEFLKESQELFSRWCVRRTKATEGLLALSRESMQAKSPIDLFEAWMRWSQGTVKRIAEDVSDQVEASTTLARCIPTTQFASGLTELTGKDRPN